MKLSKAFAFFSFIVLLSNCGSKDAAPAPSVTLTINGKAENMTFTSALLKVETAGQGRAISINAASGTKLLIIAFSCLESQNPPPDGMVVKTYYDVTTSLGLSKATCKQVGNQGSCDGLVMSWITSLDSSTGLYITGIYSGPEYEHTVKVTSNDANAKRISGEFDVKLQNGTGDVVALKGTFTNIPYNKQVI